MEEVNPVAYSVSNGSKEPKRILWFPLVFPRWHESFELGFHAGRDNCGTFLNMLIKIAFLGHYEENQEMRANL